MDLIKVGRFLSKLRKENNWTQEQLGEKIGVTNKTISRWERGNYLPPVEMLQILSEEFKVSINEILNGDRIKDEEYKKVAEETIKKVLNGSSFCLKEKIVYYKKKWKKDHLLEVIFSMVISGILFALGIVLKNGISLIGLGVGAILYIILYNRMMSYVENHAYDGEVN